MKRLVAIVAALTAATAFSGCAQEKDINGTTYKPYGIENQATNQSPNINYEISAGSVIVGVLTLETLVFPIYIIGWDLWEPVCVKPAPGRTDCNPT